MGEECPDLKIPQDSANRVKLSSGGRHRALLNHRFNSLALATSNNPKILWHKDFCNSRRADIAPPFVRTNVIANDQFWRICPGSIGPGLRFVTSVRSVDHWQLVGRADFGLAAWARQDHDEVEFLDAARQSFELREQRIGAGSPILVESSAPTIQG